MNEIPAKINNIGIHVVCQLIKKFLVEKVFCVGVRWLMNGEILCQALID